MASLEQTRELLRNLVNARVDEKCKDFFPIGIHSTNVKLLDVEVEDYLAIRDTVTIDPETAIFVPGYYEHVVDILNIGPSLMRLMRRDEEEITLTSNDGLLTTSLGPISPKFLLATLDKSDRRQINFLRRRAPNYRMLQDRYARSSETPHLRDLFGRILTVKVVACEAIRGRGKQSTLKSIAEAALFNISYARGIGLGLSRSWERSYYRLGVQRDQDIQFPRRIYNSDLLAYYHLALSSDSSILAYLSLYKILEYFYLSTAETVLHKRLREKLVSPNFSHKQAAQLRELVSIVRRFDQKTDEQKMLANVIEQYFMPDEIANWVNEHEASGGQYYTTQQTILGLSHRLDLNPEQIAPSLAKRIYHTRNALVHNKEGDLPRFIPFTGQDDVLTKELPLVLFLAESLIVKTGDDL